MSHVIHGNVVSENCWNMPKFCDCRISRCAKPAPNASAADLSEADRVAEERYEPRQLVAVVSNVVERLAV